MFNKEYSRLLNSFNCGQNENQFNQNNQQTNIPGSEVRIILSY